MSPDDLAELERDTIASGDEAVFMLQRLAGLSPTSRALAHLVIGKTLYAGAGDLQVSADAWAGDLPPLRVQLGVEPITARRALHAVVHDYHVLTETHVIHSTDDDAGYTLHRLELNRRWTRWAWQVGADRSELRRALVSTFRVTNDDGPLVQGIAVNLALYAERVSDGEVMVGEGHAEWPRWLRSAAELARRGATPASVRDLLWRLVHDDDRWRLRLASLDADEVLLSAYEILAASRRFRRPLPKPEHGPPRLPRSAGFTPRRRRRA